MATVTEPASRSGTLLAGRVRFQQPEAGYRSAIDPVLLAAACPDIAAAPAIDLGCGAGAATLCLAARCPQTRLTGIERDPALLEVFAKNIVTNGWGARITARRHDIGERMPDDLRASAKLVLANPPYLDPARHRPPADPARRGADMADTPLTGWVRLAAACLMPRGWLVMIHRADHLPALLRALAEAGHGGFGGVEIIPIQPRADQPAIRVILRARLASAGPASLRPALVLHTADGAYSGAARRLLEDGEPLAHA